MLHVVDAGDSWMKEKIDIVNETLDAIGASQERIIIYNKSDNLSEEKIAELKNNGNLVISAYKNI